MAEKQSFADEMLSRLKKQTIIKGIKEFFKKFPQAKMVLPFAKDSIGSIKGELAAYLGDFDKVFVLARKNGTTRVMVINGKMPFRISESELWTKAPFILNKTIDEYEQEIIDTGIFEEMTPEDKIKYQEFRKKMDEGGMDNIANWDLDKIGDKLKEVAGANPDKIMQLPSANE